MSGPAGSDRGDGTVEDAASAEMQQRSRSLHIDLDTPTDAPTDVLKNKELLGILGAMRRLKRPRGPQCGWGGRGWLELRSWGAYCSPVAAPLRLLRCAFAVAYISHCFCWCWW
jgi:hypothetical protein